MNTNLPHSSAISWLTLSAFCLSTSQGLASLQASGVLSGGGGRATGGSYELTDTTGQPCAGAAASEIYSMSDGFWATPGQLPSDLALSPASVAENQPSGTSAGTLVTTDADGGSFTYALVSGEGDTDNASFTLSGGELLTGGVFHQAVQPTLSVRVRATGEDGLYLEKSLTVTVLTILESWTAQAITAINPAADATPEGDPDGDGLNNLQEHAFGMNPLASSSAPLAHAGGVLTAPGTPRMLEENGRFYAVFTRRADHHAARLSYQPQFSASVADGSWTSSAATPEVLATGDGMQAVRVRFPGFVTTPTGPQKARFFRVGVSRNP